MEEICVPVEQAMGKKRSGISMITGILLGGLVGAGVALLSAPRSGMETRQMIREKSMEIKDKAVDTAYQTRSRAEEIVRKGSEKATELADRGKSTLQSTVEGVKEGMRTYRSNGDYGIEGSTMIIEDLDTGTTLIVDDSE